MLRASAYSYVLFSMSYYFELQYIVYEGSTIQTKIKIQFTWHDAIHQAGNII